MNLFSFDPPLLPLWQLYLYCHSMTRTRESIFHEVQSVSRRIYDLQKNQTNKDLEKNFLQTCQNGHKFPHHDNCLQNFTLNISHTERFTYHSSFWTIFLKRHDLAINIQNSLIAALQTCIFHRKDKNKVYCL